MAASPFDNRSAKIVFLRKKNLSMLTIHPQYINDANGNPSLVVLPAQEFESMMDELEELDDIRLFDEAKKEDTGERILFSDYLNSRKAKHA